jgi:demethylmenaquinone methyltransferase / 2-methoxy-6-polyprenyl-1,4-benzoquinol methylase
MSRTRESMPGTHIPDAACEREAGQRVREMFSRIAPRYDLLNHMLSLQVDRLWRLRLARRFRHLLANPEARVLDLCCGTGDLAVSFRREGPARVVGADFSHPMLTRALAKAAARAGVSVAACGNRSCVEGDALALPFRDGQFDLVAAAFGFRNLANYECGLAEIRRVLKPGGSLAILEFSEPRNRLLGALYGFYFRSVLPRIGRAISRDVAAYSYLPASVGRFLSAEQLAGLLENGGFRSARYEFWTGGIVALHTATR